MAPEAQSGAEFLSFAPLETERSEEMPVNLTQPLRWKAANSDEGAMLADLQGTRSTGSFKTPETLGSTNDVGLIFIAFRSYIENQFEFARRSWVNSAAFLEPGTGIDPVIEQAPASPKQTGRRSGESPEPAPLISTVL